MYDHTSLSSSQKVSDKRCRENQNTHCMFNIFPENHTFYEKMWKNTVDRGRRQMKIWRMRIDWIPKATNTHSEYVILIAFPLQQWW